VCAPTQAAAAAAGPGSVSSPRRLLARTMSGSKLLEVEMARQDGNWGLALVCGAGWPDAWQDIYHHHTLFDSILFYYYVVVCGGGARLKGECAPPHTTHHNIIVRRGGEAPCPAIRTGVELAAARAVTRYRWRGWLTVALLVGGGWLSIGGGHGVHLDGAAAQHVLARL
jgi:hypothetical protein